MKTSHPSYLAVLTALVLICSTAGAYWEEQQVINDRYFEEYDSVGPNPRDTYVPPEDYAFESYSFSISVIGFAWGIVDTRAYKDGEYYYMDPETMLTVRGDVQSTTSGSAQARGSRTRAWQWKDGGCVYCDPFNVYRVLTIQHHIIGDADNGALSAGSVTVQSSATATAAIDYGPRKDINLSVVKVFAENDSWSPDGLALTIGGQPSIRLEWDDPAGWWDDSFEDWGYNETPFIQVVTQDFAIVEDGRINISEVKSTNNAERAFADVYASSGYSSADDGYWNDPYL